MKTIRIVSWIGLGLFAAWGFIALFHTLTHRPIVIPAEREVRVKAASANAGAEIYVTFDGQHGFPLSEGVEVAVTRSPKPIKLVRAATRSYFEVLREKLKWGER